MIRLASDSGNVASLVFFLFDLLYVEGEALAERPLIERKARLAGLLSNVSSPLHYCDHQIGHGREFHDKASIFGLMDCQTVPAEPCRTASRQRPHGDGDRVPQRHLLMAEMKWWPSRNPPRRGGRVHGLLSL
jgi:hypothetical protein